MSKGTGYPHLANAPITEALIDIQVRYHELPTNDVLRSVAQAMKDAFPLLEERQQTTISISMVPEAETNMVHQPYGFLLHSADKHYAAQILQDRFSLSRLTPYIDWADLRDQAKQFWQIYRDIAAPKRVVRLAVRYINKLLLPSPIEDFSVFFTKPIEIPESLPQGLASYMTRMALPEPETGSVALIQQVLEGVTLENEVSIIFDIDTFKQVDLAADNDEEIWSDLENLRDYKNRVFFKSLTNRAIELFQ